MLRPASRSQDDVRRRTWTRRPPTGGRMSDETIATRIERLVHEEHELRTREEHDSTDDGALAEDRDRLRDVEIELDRCSDLLRQRRALRPAGADPDAAAVRDEKTVEGYLQ